MLIKQEKINRNIVEIRTSEFNGQTCYCVDLREIAGNWPYHWEIRQDGTRSCMCEFKSTLEEANKTFSEYMKKAGAA